MDFFKENRKNIIIGVLFILFISACFIIFYLLNEKKETKIKSITGTVIISDKNYVMIESEKENYIISNIKGNYEVGDKVLFTYKNTDIKTEENPKTIKISDEELLSKKEVTQVEEEKSPTNENIVPPTNNEGNKANNDIANPSNNTGNSGSSNNTIPNNSSISKSADEEVMSYFTSLESDFNATSIKDSLKNGFITVVDFLFYNGKIKGHTFNELTNAVKLKVLSMALYFDSKIEKYFPGYKESISSTATKVYTNVKSKIISSYLTLTTSICNANSELCVSAKNGFAELKKNFGLTFDLIKEIAGDGLTNLKSWYEIWSGK